MMARKTQVIIVEELFHDQDMPDMINAHGKRMEIAQCRAPPTKSMLNRLSGREVVDRTVQGERQNVVRHNKTPRKGRLM